MMTVVQRWWQARSRREQGLLAVLAGLVLVTVLWLGVMLPLARAEAQSRQREAQAVAANARIKELAAAIRAAPANRSGPPATSAMALDAVLTSRAAAADLTFASVDIIDAGAARITMTAVRPTALLGFAATLENEAQLVIESIVITRNADGTVAAQLNVRSVQ